MAGAEGDRRLDFDADAVGRDARAIVRAVHDEATGGDRLQPGEALLHPVGRCHAAELQCCSGLAPGGRIDRGPHRSSVDRRAEVNRDLPASAAAVRQTDGDIFTGEAIGDQIAEALRYRFIGCQPREQDGAFAAITADIGTLQAFWPVPGMLRKLAKETATRKRTNHHVGRSASR